MSDTEREEKAPAAAPAPEPSDGDEKETDLFSERLHRYLSLRAAEAVGAAVSSQLDEAARRLVFTPASAPWQILFKFDVLQATQNFGGVWTDERETAFLGAIRADVIRWI